MAVYLRLQRASVFSFRRNFFRSGIAAFVIGITSAHSSHHHNNEYEFREFDRPFKSKRSITTDEEVAWVDGRTTVEGCCGDSRVCASHDADVQNGAGAANQHFTGGFKGLGASPTPKCRQPENGEVEFAES